jgi:hypothetical protein
MLFRRHGERRGTSEPYSNNFLSTEKALEPRPMTLRQAREGNRRKAQSRGAASGGSTKQERRLQHHNTTSIITRRGSTPSSTRLA